MKQYAGEASAALQEALPFAIKLSETAGVPGLSIGLEALLTILEKIEVCRCHGSMGYIPQLRLSTRP